MKCGFCKKVITPPLGTPLIGYYRERLAKGVWDDLYVRAVAFESDGVKAVIVELDICLETEDVCDLWRKTVAEFCNMDENAVFISCNHTHTGPLTTADFASDKVADPHYMDFLEKTIRDAAFFAFEDVKPARFFVADNQAKGISFVRRYRMKDGSVRTNPGIGNPDILEQLGKPDDQVHVLRFDRESAETLVLMHFGSHPDTVGGCKFSADWPGFARRILEQAIPGTKAIFFNGAEGEVGVQNVRPVSGDMNGLALDFDDVYRGYESTENLGRCVAGAVMQIYGRVEYVDVERIACARRTIRVPANVPTLGELPLAREYAALHEAGQDEKIPYTGMQLTTVVAEALRMVRLADGPEYFEMDLSGVAIGPVAFVGVPGEPFAGVSFGLEEAPGWGTVFTVCNANGKEGYFPMQDAYDEGGYEARSSAFKAGVAELIIEEGKALLRTLGEQA